jgi:hypothetical protein
MHQRHAVLVAVARKYPRFGVITEMDARLADGEHRDFDAVPIHVLDSLLIVPFDDRRLPGAHWPEHLPVHRRRIVIVDIDDPAPGRRWRQRLLRVQYLPRKCRGSQRC